MVVDVGQGVFLLGFFRAREGIGGRMASQLI
jgi:hypothetical protein